MENIDCGTEGCINRVEYYHLKEEWYYCEECAYSYFYEWEFEKIGSVTIINQMVKFCMNMLDKVKHFVDEEQLTTKWIQELDQHKIFWNEVADIIMELKQSLDAHKLNNLLKIQKRSTVLKLRKSKYLYYFKK